MPSVLGGIADAIDFVNGRIGRAVAWLYPVLVIVVGTNVALRYLFGLGMIELEEVQWHLNATAFLLGYGYTYIVNDHVRVDVFHSRLKPRTQAIVELLGSFLLLLPFTLIVADYAFDFFWQSWLIGERSDMPSGLPARYVMKFILFLAMVLLGLQAISVGLDRLLFLLGYKRA